MDRRSFIAGGAMTALAMSRAGAAEQVSVRTGPVVVDAREDVVVRIHDRPVFTYHRQPVQAPSGGDALFTRSGYIHPVHAPNGAVVTDDFATDHPHQRGVFFAWTKTEIGGLHPDFWNLGSGTGRIRCLGTGLSLKSARAGFEARHAWEMKEGAEWKTVLDERWVVSILAPTSDDAQAPGAFYQFDLTSHQTPRVDILLPEYRYGGMAVRGARAWMTDPKALQVLTSEGKDRATADASRAGWVDQSGAIDGREAGIALLEHPSNLGAPNMLRVPTDHPYAVFSPPKAGDVKLQAGQEYVFRYRLIAHNGRGTQGMMAPLWEVFRKE